MPAIIRAISSEPTTTAVVAAEGDIRRWGELQAMEAFWPDSGGKFPFEVGCDLAACQIQPRLDIGLTPRELRWWRRQWE